MLWYKTWLETRLRFLVGLAVLLCSAAGVVLQYPRVVELLGQMPAVSLGGEIGRRVQEAVEHSRHYRSYVWSQGFRQNLAQMGTLFAVVLGTGVFFHFSRGAALYTLSLPVSRSRLLGVRAATGLAQWLAMALLPSLLIAVLSPTVGQSFGLVDALAHGLCLFFAGAVFFSLTVLLSTLFAVVWRPLLLALLAAVVLSIPDQVGAGWSRYSLSGLMSGEAFFRTGRMPWLGLFAAASLSAALLYGAARNFARRDF